MEKMNELTKRKKEIEEEIGAHLSILDSQGGVGMSEPLVDGEGFPRNDVDLVVVRQSRQRVICLRNDHEALMKEIEAELVCIHQRARETGILSPSSSASRLNGESGMDVDSGGSGGGGGNVTARVSPQPPPRHFARIAQVAAGSPAETAGLESNDLLVRFGSITCDNFQKLQDVASIVNHSKDAKLTLTVCREANGNGSGTWKTIDLTLVPQTWSGRGLLGCNIVPQSCAESRMTS